MKKLMRIPKWLFITIVLLIALRIVLPTICLWGINWALANKMENYIGHIDDFDLSVWRGAYQLQKLEIKKRNSSLPPLLTAKEIDLSIAWRSVFKGEISADVTVDTLIARLIDGEKKDQKQFGTDEKTESWQATANVIVPLTIETLYIHDSEAYFSNSTLGKKITISLTQGNLIARDLRSQQNIKGGAASPFEFEAVLQKHAMIRADGLIDLMTCPNRVDIDVVMRNFDVNTLNSALRTYIPIDVTQGKLDIFLEAASSNKISKGYVKAFFEDGDILAPKQDYDSAKHYFSEIGVSFANWVLKNKKTKTTASIIPFEIKNEKLNIDTSKAFWSAVKNKEEKPLEKKLDKSINLGAIEGQNPPTRQACPQG